MDDKSTVTFYVAVPGTPLVSKPLGTTSGPGYTFIRPITDMVSRKITALLYTNMPAWVGRVTSHVTTLKITKTPST
jgi:hypothetical protein